MKKKIIIICGPTGVGKTGFAIDLAKAFDGEIIGADSMQIYKFMDIGTAKPDEHERSMAPHHLIDCIDPADTFDAARYAKFAASAVEKIFDNEKLPIAAGGTGFYIKALLYGLFNAHKPNQLMIEALEQEKKEKGSKAIYDRLKTLDPETAHRLHPNDGFRIIRALEVISSTGSSITALQKQHGFLDQRYIPFKIGLKMDREKLYTRIDKRVDIMIEQGLVREVEKLNQMGYHCGLKSMNSIGYRHICDYLNGKVAWDETIRLFKRDTRRYAKRQFTWFRKETDIIWLEPHEIKRAEQLVSQFLNQNSLK